MSATRDSKDFPNQNKAIMLSDLARSTIYKDESGHKKGTERIILGNELCKLAIKKNGGIVHKNLGDGLLTIFDHQISAINSAISIINESETSKIWRDSKLEFKFAITFGSIERFSQEYCKKVMANAFDNPWILDSLYDGEEFCEILGIHVDLCARILSLAKPNQILITDAACNLSRGMLRDANIKKSEPKYPYLKDFECEIGIREVCDHESDFKGINDYVLSTPVEIIIDTIKDEDLISHGLISSAIYEHEISTLKESLKGKQNRIDELTIHFGKACALDSLIERKEKIMKTHNKLQHLITTIGKEWEKFPVLLDLVNSKQTILYDEISMIISPEGYNARNLEEFKLIVNLLFSDSLKLLRATSINSKQEELLSFRSYWDDPVIGKFFRKKNEDFLQKQGKGSIDRIFLCDSLVKAVKESWFCNTLVPQVEQGVTAKVLELDKTKLQSYEDFGIYHHIIGQDLEARYILSAPREENLEGILNTKLISDQNEANEYSIEFDIMWSSISESVRIIKYDGFSHNTNDIHGDGCINDIFNNKIILRNMKRLDTDDDLLRGKKGFVRKFEPEYADALYDHISTKYDQIETILYFGDTADNDGGVIRNLQKLNLNVFGFICEPSLKLNNIWFNQIYYSSKWVDVLGFLSILPKEIFVDNGLTLAVFDIDQTLWAPKGLHETPLNKARKAAIRRLFDRYIDSESPQKRYVIESSDQIYSIIKGVDYDDITLDNEDYKAAISVFLSLGLYHGGMENDSLKRDFDKAILDQIFQDYRGDSGIFEFMKEVYSEAHLNPKAANFMKKNGLL